MAQIHLRLKELYEKEGGAFPDPILNLQWPYADPNDPKADEIAKEINGYALADVMDPTDPTKVLVEAGKQVAGLRGAARRRLHRLRLLDLSPAATTRTATTWRAGTIRIPTIPAPI